MRPGGKKTAETDFSNRKSTFAKTYLKSLLTGTDCRH